MPMASGWASAGMSSARSRGASAAAAGSMRCWCGRPAPRAGVSGIALTKLDVLDGFKTLKICVGYDLDGERLDYLPTAANLQARVHADL